MQMKYICYWFYIQFHFQMKNEQVGPSLPQFYSDQVLHKRMGKSRGSEKVFVNNIWTFCVLSCVEETQSISILYHSQGLFWVWAQAVRDDITM